jgi:hypothetical protein
MIFTIEYVASVFKRSFKTIFSSVNAFIFFALIALVNQIVLGNKAVIEDGLSALPSTLTLFYKALPAIISAGLTLVISYPVLVVLGSLLLIIYFIGSALYTIAVMRNIALVYTRKWNGLLGGLASASSQDLWWLLVLRLVAYACFGTLAVLVFAIAYKRWLDYGQDLIGFLIAIYFIVLPYYSGTMWLGSVLSSFSLPISQRSHIFRSIVTSRNLIVLYFFFLFRYLTSLLFFIAIPWFSGLIAQGVLIPICSLLVGLIVENMFRLSGYELVEHMIKNSSKQLFKDIYES